MTKLYVKIDPTDLETSALVGVSNVLNACELTLTAKVRVLAYLLDRLDPGILSEPAKQGAS